MSIQHSAITDPDIHEPKGASTAAAGTVYISDGAGSGSWQVNAAAKYGEIIITNSAVAQTLSAASAYAKLNPLAAWAANISNGITLDPTNGQYTITTAGVYQLNFWINFTTAAAASGSTYNFKYAVNGVVSSQVNKVTKVTNGVDALDTFASALVTLAANDVVSIYVAGDATTSSTNITPVNAAFSAILLKAS